MWSRKELSSREQSQWKLVTESEWEVEEDPALESDTASRFNLQVSKVVTTLESITTEDKWKSQEPEEDWTSSLGPAPGKPSEAKLTTPTVKLPMVSRKTSLEFQLVQSLLLHAKTSAQESSQLVWRKSSPIWDLKKCSSLAWENHGLLSESKAREQCLRWEETKRQEFKPEEPGPLDTEVSKKLLAEE